MEKEKESKIVETTTYDERRKILIHKSAEEKTNELGDLKITTIAEIHEKGIRQTLKDYEKRKEILKENIQIVSENLGPAPKMTPELHDLKKKLTALQQINRKKNETEQSRKKEEAELENYEKDLKMVEKDLKDIKEAIGSRMKF